MRRPSVTLAALTELRRGFVFWALGMIALSSVYIAVYPTVRDSPSLNEMIERYPEAIKGMIEFGGEVDYTSGVGYLGAEVFSFMAPLLFAIAAIAAGTGALAGERERGTLELLLAQPITRRRLVAEKLAALVAELAGLGVVLWLALWVGVQLVDLKVSAGNLAAAVVSTVLLALVFGTVAMALGAFLGRRGLAVGLTASLAVGAYLVNALAPLSEALDAIRVLSPYYHYGAGNPLRSGLDLAHAGILAGIAAVAAIATAVTFEGRDIAS